MLRIFSSLALCAWLFLPAAGSAADGEVIIIEGTCVAGQHLDLDGDCICNSSTDIMVDFECVPDPSRFFGQLTDVFIDFCQFVGHCGGGGGGPQPEPEPEPGLECTFEDEEGNDLNCLDRWNKCASDAFHASNACPETLAEKECQGPPADMVFPDGSKPECRIVSKTGAILCNFENPGKNPPFVGDLNELFDYCVGAWIRSGQLKDEIQACQKDAITQLDQCQIEVLVECAEAGCEDFEPPLATLAQSQRPGADAPPTHEVFLRTKVRTRGESAIDGEALARNGTRTTCYWHLTSEGTLPPDATLFCKGNEEWENVGTSRFLLADDGNYVADGACGVATDAGMAIGDATYRWKLERAEDGAFLNAKVRSIAGSIEGSLDGAHPYFGDCKVTGKAIEERQVPSGLLELLR